MQLFSLKLVTVIAEAVLTKKICERASELGATGYTCTESFGNGSRDARNASLAGSNVRIEIVCSDEVAKKILTYVSHNFFEHYACIAWVGEVSVMRGAEFANVRQLDRERVCMAT